MATLPNGPFNANDVEPSEKMIGEPAFTGWHPMIFTDSEMKPTKKGDGQMLQLVATVTAGQWKGRKLWVRLNIDNPSQTAVEIAYRELSAICRACGTMLVTDSQQLHNRPFLGNVEFEAATDKGAARNNLVAYKPADGGVPAAQNAPAPTPAPAAASKKPWERSAA